MVQLVARNEREQFLMQEALDNRPIETVHLADVLAAQDEYDGPGETVLDLTEDNFLLGLDVTSPVGP